MRSNCQKTKVEEYIQQKWGVLLEWKKRRLESNTGDRKKIWKLKSP